MPSTAILITGQASDQFWGLLLLIAFRDFAAPHLYGRKSEGMKQIALLSAFLLFAFCAQALNSDTLPPKALKEVIIKGWQRNDVSRLPDERNGFLAIGKKNEVVSLSGINANVAVKTGRQVFAKIPGVFIYDMDGSGNQVNIATRGLDPHRSWEFNNRQNGVIINSDMYGYPASHYSAPMESYERVEFIRGTGSLQYGSQFGGMINYITKAPDSTKPVSLESIVTVGSLGLMSSYTAISGTYKNFSYNAYYHRRHSDGYRSNSESDATAQFVQLAYRFHPSFSLRAEFGRSEYQYHIPGPLNDSMFRVNPTTSTRSRNYFSPDIYVPSITADWKISSSTKILVTASGLFGSRNSVQLDAFATVPDTINRLTEEYKNRQVDIDRFHSRTVEARLLHCYYLGKQQHKLAAGIVYMNNDLHRRQLGKGSRGTNYDLRIEGEFGRDLHFKTVNVALFAENSFALTSRWTVSPGVRMEMGESEMSGRISYYTVHPLPTVIRHQFVLAGISSQYQLTGDNNVYGGISQAYRPVIFKDIVPASVYEQIDKNLKDAFGYNAEIGVRGKLFKRLQYDVSLFQVLYKNRMGAIVMEDAAGQPFVFRTNVGDARTSGAEVFMQYRFPVTTKLYAGLFTSTTYTHAHYINGQIADGSTNKSIRGNRVEAVPDWITRNGLEILYKGFSGTILYSYTSSTFSDPLNTVIPPATGAKGLTPGYGIWDVNVSCFINSKFTVKAGVSNLFDKQYFTKRPTFYPGSGIWPSDGRSMYMTLAVKL